MQAIRLSDHHVWVTRQTSDGSEAFRRSTFPEARTLDEHPQRVTKHAHSPTGTRSTTAHARSHR